MILRNLNRTLLVSILSLSVVLTSPARADVLSCLTIYTPRAAENLISYSFLSDLVRRSDNRFEAVVPIRKSTGIELEYKEMQRWEDVEFAFRNINHADRLIAQTLMNTYMNNYGRIAGYFTGYARNNKIEIETRLKDIQSLRNKIIDRAKEFSKRGSVFRFEFVDDFIGIRLMPDKTSDLMAPFTWGEHIDQSRLIEHFESALGLANVGKVTSVEIKGGHADQAKNRYYRAIHVTLEMGNSAVVEVQTMSKSMATWHHWDHPIVYKSSNKDENYRESLKNYSRFWVRLIRLLEDQRLSKDFDQNILSLATEYNLDPNYLKYSTHVNANWVIGLDSVVAKKLAIRDQDRFLGTQSSTPLRHQLQLFADFASPLLL